MGKPSPTLLGLAVAAVISMSGCAGGLFPSGEEPARQVTRRGPGSKFPNAADPGYKKTYAQHREQMADRQVVAPALGLEQDGDANMVHQAGLGSGVSSAAKSISSSVQKGVAKVGKILTPEERVVKAAEPTSVFNRSEPSPDLHVAVARLHEQSGKLAQAEQQYRLALEIAPGHLGGLLGYAHLQDRLGHLDEAIQWYQQAAGAHPNEPSVFNDMALCCARNGRFDEALTALNRAVELQPKKPLYRNNIAIVLTEMGQTDSALLHLRVVQREAVARYNLGQLLLRKGQREAAAEQFALALRSDPSLEQAKAWLDELARSDNRPGQTSARIAAKPPASSPRRTVPRPRPAPREPSTTTRQPTGPDLAAPEGRPAAQDRPTPENRPARDLRSVYGHFPVPPGRRLRSPPPTPGRPPAPPETAPGTPTRATRHTSAPERPPRPPDVGPTAPQPSPVRRPAAAAPMSNPFRSHAPGPPASGSTQRLPALRGPDPTDAVAPLPPVTGSGSQVEQIEPLPPVEPAPVPGQ